MENEYNNIDEDNDNIEDLLKLIRDAEDKKYYGLFNSVVRLSKKNQG